MGYTPLCFVESAEVVRNVWVARRQEMSPCKRLKMLCLRGFSFESARAFEMKELSRGEVQDVGTEGPLRSLPNAEEIVEDLRAFVKLEVFMGSVRSN